MFAHVCLILGALLAADVTLPNGIRVAELPPASEGFDIVAGYQSGRGPLASIVSAFLLSTKSARKIAMIVQGSGGKIDVTSDPDRSAIHVTGPRWAETAVLAELPAFFSQIPQDDPDLVSRAFTLVKSRPSDFRSTVEETVRGAVLGENGVQNGSVTDLDEYFNANYGTDRAFVLSSVDAVAILEQTPIRKSVRPTTPGTPATRREKVFRFKPDLPEGAVILATPTAAVYFESWYRALLLDQLIRRRIPGSESILLPSLEPYYYRLEVPVPQGQFDDVVESRLIESLEALQFMPADPNDLEAARSGAIRFLDSEPTRRWYRGFGLERNRLEGIAQVRSFSADDVRVAARDLLEDHVVATWSPKPKEIRIEVESLDAPAADGRAAETVTSPKMSSVGIPAFPPHTDTVTFDPSPERLSSGVTLLASSAYAIFVAPADLKIFDHEPTAAEINTYGRYRAGRILVMAPPSALLRVKPQWTAFQGDSKDTFQVTFQDDVPNLDLPALVVLQMILDRRLIDAGLWSQAQIEVRAEHGARLIVHGDDVAVRAVSSFIDAIVGEPPSAEETSWAREAAFHHIDSMKPDLQSLIWLRDPQGVLGSMSAVEPAQIQRVAKIHSH